MTHQMVPNERDILERQKEKFRALMERVMRDNPFYGAKYEPLGFSARRPPRLDELPALPFTLKSELVDDQQRHPPYGRDLTFPLSRYTRIHQTSGTTGRPLRWLDTAESWQWWLDCWQEIYRAAGVSSDDRIFVAFSFGPFIGFWTAFEAGQRLGAMVMPGGGLSSKQRLETLLENEATVLVCTPTYALRLAEVARESGIDLASSTIRITIHAGEPGASVPNVKSRIEAAWGARCVDHAGATEVGAWGYSCGERNHMHVNEAEFIAEVIDPETQALVEPDAEGVQRGELVLTNLGRVGSPVIRYRTGDLVELTRQPCPCGRTTAVLRGGVLGRIDHMFIIRGINVFPSALENLIRAFPDIEEFEVSVEHRRAMAELVIRIEVNGQRPADVAAALEQHVHERLNLRPVVRVVDRGSLPRYELKARRFKFSQERR